jgi:hypothetical protein
MRLVPWRFRSQPVAILIFLIQVTHSNVLPCPMIRMVLPLLSRCTSYSSGQALLNLTVWWLSYIRVRKGRKDGRPEDVKPEDGDGHKSYHVGERVHQLTWLEDRRSRSQSTELCRGKAC